MSTSTETRRFAPLAAGTGPARADERVAARSLGYAEGLSSGQRVAAAQAQAVIDAAERERLAAAAQARQQLELAVAGLGRATQRLQADAVPGLEQMADSVLGAAVELARAILATELSVVDDAALAAVRRALAPLPGDVPVTVRLHPADHAYVLAHVADGEPTSTAASAVLDGHDVRLVADAGLSRGDAVAEQAGSVVDARIGAALDRAVEALRGQR